MHDELLASKPANVAHDASSCHFCATPAAETAEEHVVTTPAAIDPNDPTIKAIVDARVATETAALTERAETAERERDEAKSKLDVAESERAALTTRAETAEKALDDVKAAEQAAEEARGRIDGRVAAMREVAGHLPDTWFADAERRERWGRMADDEFDAHKAELAATFEAAGIKPQAGPPRETAMEGGAAPVSPTTTDKPSASTAFIAGTSSTGRRNIPAQV